MNGTISHVQGFSGGSALIDDGGTPLAVGSTGGVARTGTYYGESNATSSNKGYGVFEFWTTTAILSGNTHGFSCSIPFRIDTTPAAGGTNPHTSLASISTGLIPEVAITDTRELVIVTQPSSGGAYGTIWWTGSFTMSEDTWYVLHLQQYKAAFSGATPNWPIRVKLYNDAGTTIHDDSGWQQPIYTGASATNVNSVSVGQFSLPTTAGVFQYDDIVAVYGGAGAPIAPKVLGLFPGGDSATDNTWNEGTTATPNRYTDVDDFDDASYIQDTLAAAGSLTQLFTPVASGLTSENVYGLAHRIRWQETAAGSGTSQLAFKNSAGTVSVGASHVPPSSWDYDSRKMHPFEPGTQETWTATKLNTPVEFGVRMTRLVGTFTMQVTQTFLEVAYGGSHWVDDRLPRCGWISHNNATGGTVTVPSTTTLKDSAASWHPGLLAGATITIDSGTGSGQSRHITTNTADTVTISAAWTTNPDSTSKYSITMTGTATSATASTLTNTNKAYIPKGLVGQIIKITGGTGASASAFAQTDAERTITDNTATVITVAPNFATTPDSTSTYEIFSMGRST